MQEYSEDYLLDKRVRIFQPLNGYRASTDAVILSSLIARIKRRRRRSRRRFRHRRRRPLPGRKVQNAAAQNYGT